jgi:hypothetical protein
MGSADAFSDQSKPRPTPYADPSSPERFLSPSSFEGPQEVLNEDDTQVQLSTNPQKSQAHERIRSGKG